MRLESPGENPAAGGGFKHPDLLAWVGQERPPDDRGNDDTSRLLCRRSLKHGISALGLFRGMVRSVCDATIGLQGAVSSCYLKQVAQEVILGFDRGWEVRNGLRVTSKKGPVIQSAKRDTPEWQAVCRHSSQPVALRSADGALSAWHVAEHCAE